MCPWRSGDCLFSDPLNWNYRRLWAPMWLLVWNQTCLLQEPSICAVNTSVTCPVYFSVLNRPPRDTRCCLLLLLWALTSSAFSVTHVTPPARWLPHTLHNPYVLPYLLSFTVPSASRESGEQEDGGFNWEGTRKAIWSCVSHHAGLSVLHAIILHLHIYSFK